MIRTSVCLFLLILGATASANDVADRVAQDVIVKWRELPAELDAALLPAAIQPMASTIRQALPVCSRTSGGLERISIVTLFNPADMSAVIDALREDPRVEYVEPRMLRHTDEFHPFGGREHGGDALDGVPNDPFYSQQWGLQAMEAEAAWNITRGDPNVVIAVLDVGVQFYHPELTRCRWENAAELSGSPGIDDDGNGFTDDFYGWNFVEGNGEPWPDTTSGPDSHGSHVAGLACAERNNGMGIAGLAPDCKLMSVRVGGYGSIGYGYEGIYYACRAGADVINCSWGGESESAYERDVIQYVLDQGCVVVGSAGNSYMQGNLTHYPAGIEGVMSVAASQLGDYISNFTQRGSWVKVSAPGVAMLSTIVDPTLGNTYGLWQGTSMAAPIAAATCALAASRFPTLRGRALMARVMASCDPIDDHNQNFAGMLGTGRVNAYRVLTDSVQGVRIGDVEFEESSGNGDGRIRAGEMATIRISVYNDLGSIQGIFGSVASTAANVSLHNPILTYSSVPHGGPYWSETAVGAELAITAERGFVLPLTVDFIGEDDLLLGRGTRLVYLDSTFVCMNNGRLDLGFAENGSLGYNDYIRQIYVGCGLKLSDRSNALYHGSFLLAADGWVSDNSYGNATLNLMDWSVMPDSIAHFIAGERADIEARTTFEDRSAEQPLFAQVRASCLSWTNPNAQGFLILEYVVKNRSVNAWNEAYAGFFLDWDLGPAGGNIAAYDETGGIAYVRATSSGHPLAGIAAVTDPWGGLYVVNNRAEIDAPANWSDSTKWAHLRSGHGTIPSDPMDLSMLISAGPVRIEGQSERTFAYAFVSGETPEDLRANAQLARDAYVSDIPPEPASTLPARVEKAGLYPNPLTVGGALRLRVPHAQTASVTFFNILGQEIASFRNIQVGSESMPLDLSGLDRTTGLLLYRVEYIGGSASGKLLILR